jgi:hypothetical protein
MKPCHVHAIAIHGEDNEGETKWTKYKEEVKDEIGTIVRLLACINLKLINKIASGLPQTAWAPRNHESRRVDATGSLRVQD